jgi:hypothetical protein
VGEEEQHEAVLPKAIAEIEEEEEYLEAISAVTVADVAAAAAAEAEALAEASSARTREARRIAEQAEQVLGQVRLAIRNGTLTGEEARHRLYQAEQQYTRAFAQLADAEAAEEEARNDAMNAEAEAEVAEGMAIASLERAEMVQEESGSPPAMDKDAQPVDEEDTQPQIPVVRPQEL